MRKRTIICILSLVGLGLWGCGDRQPEGQVSGVTPTIGAGQFHNDVLKAFDRRASLARVEGMGWEEWQEAVLASIEESSAAHGVAFDREETLREMETLFRVFHALEKTTGINPGTLHASPNPDADFAVLAGQLREWKLIDEPTAESLRNFTVRDAARRASTTPDSDLREVYEIGAASFQFWTREVGKSRDPFVVPPVEDQPCVTCRYGAAFSDMVGGLIGRIYCLGKDLRCRERYAAIASVMFNMLADYCANHNCNGDDYGLPPIP